MSGVTSRNDGRLWTGVLLSHYMERMAVLGCQLFHGVLVDTGRRSEILFILGIWSGAAHG